MPVIASSFVRSCSANVLFQKDYLYAVVLNNGENLPFDYAFFIPEAASNDVTSGLLVYIANNVSSDCKPLSREACNTILGMDLLLAARLADISDFGSAHNVAGAILELGTCLSRRRHINYAPHCICLSGTIDELHEVGMVECLDPEAFELEIVNAATVALRPILEEAGAV